MEDPARMQSRSVVTSIAATILLLSLALPASAQDFARNGFYAGGDLLGGHYTDEPSGVDVDTAFGFDLYAGFRVHPNFAFEGEFEMLPDADVEVSGFGDVADLQTWTLTANSKLFFVTGRVQPHLKFGMGIMNAELDADGGAGGDEDDTAFTVKFGGGLDYYLTGNVVLSAGLDYVIPTGDLDDLDYLSFGGGAQYRF